MCRVAIMLRLCLTFRVFTLNMLISVLIIKKNISVVKENNFSLVKLLGLLRILSELMQNHKHQSENFSLSKTFFVAL